MVSALEHMCIPIDPAWDLDGNVFGTSCSLTVNLEDGAEQPDHLVRYLVHFESIEVRCAEDANYKLQSSDGKVVVAISMKGGVPQLVSTSEIGAGVYFWTLENETGHSYSDKLVIH